MKIVIAGAGIGGLAAALGLLRSGQRVRLYEQVSELGEVGALFIKFLHETKDLVSLFFANGCKR